MIHSRLRGRNLIVCYNFFTKDNLKICTVLLLLSRQHHWTEEWVNLRGRGGGKVPRIESLLPYWLHWSPTTETVTANGLARHWRAGTGFQAGSRAISSLPCPHALYPVGTGSSFLIGLAAGAWSWLPACIQCLRMGVPLLPCRLHASLI